MSNRVIQFIESGGPGGAEHVMLSLASGLMAREHSVKVIAPYDGYVAARCRDLKIPCLVLDSRRHRDVTLVQRLRRAFMDSCADVIHAHGLDAGVYASLAGIAVGPVVATLHGAVELCKGGPFRLRAKKWILRWTGCTLVAVSNALRSQVVTRGLARGPKILTIHNGVDFESFARVRWDESLRSCLQIPASTPVVGTVANARQEKGYDRFLQAAVRIVGARPDARFVIAGRLSENQEARIKKRVAELGLEQCVRLLGFRADIQRVYDMMDVFVLASDSEGFSLATVEAMALGKPVVVTRCGGPEEIIEDGETGLLVDLDGGEPIADRVLWLLEHPAAARRISERATESVRKRFDIIRMVGAYESLYDQLLQDGRRAKARP